MRAQVTVAALLAATLFGCSSPRPPAAPPVPLEQAATPRGGDGCRLEGLVSPIFSDDDASWGSLDAPVVVVLFSDFQCPYCSLAASELEKVKGHYGPSRLRVVHRNKPLQMHRYARFAADVGAAVRAMGGNAAFLRYHDITFSRQDTITPSSLLDWGVEAGIADRAALEQAVTAGTHGRPVEADLLLSKQLGISGTPTYLLNGHGLDGLQDQGALSSLIDDELALYNKAPRKGFACARFTESWKPAKR